MIFFLFRSLQQNQFVKLFISACLFFLFFFLPGQSYAQKVNGRALSFPNGKTAWSDTIFMNLRTKKMVRQGLPAVKIGLQYKFVKNEVDGTLYQMGFTNCSGKTPVRFKVTASQRADIYTVRLQPGETKVIQRKKWKNTSSGSPGEAGAEDDFMMLLLEEVIDKGGR